jgi:uncharacterized protein (TIGR03382 family)
VIPPTGYQFAIGQTSVTVRVQFGVFDDAGGAAPAGGFIGWNVGTMNGTPPPVVGSGAARLAPFNFASTAFAGTQSPLALNNIDNTLGTQSLVWNGGTAGGTVPDPAPPAVVRGRNGFISTFAIVLAAATNDFDVTAAGNTLVATAWNVIQTTEPDPGPDGLFDGIDDTNGSILYAPATLPAIPFTGCTAHFLTAVPAPGAAALLGLGGLVAFRRRRA